MTYTLRFAALVLSALLVGPTLAHVLELPAKLALSRADYLTVQQLYRGWALFGIPIVLDLLAIAVLAWRLRGARRQFGWTVAALLCLLAAQAVFWTWTYPANVATQQWTMLPDDWQALRRQWEFSHAAAAAFTFATLVCLIASVLPREAGGARLSNDGDRLDTAIHS
jgi:hypothetical protein